MSRICKLYTGPQSQFSGKVRSCLLKKHIPYRELFMTHPDFEKKVLPTMWHVQDPLRVAGAVSGADKARLDDLIQRTGGAEFMTIKLDCPIIRENYDFVVGA